MTSSEKIITEMPLGGGVVEDKRYPTPQASHEEVVKDPTLFMDSLRCFHSLLGSRFMIPVIGGKELDLHLLYVEVTKRGGFQKVVEEKKWRDVSKVFSLSPTATSASYVLRRHYLSLLQHYEQVYFFKLQGPLFTPTGAVSLSIKSPPSYSRPEKPDFIDSASHSMILMEQQQQQQHNTLTGTTDSPDLQSEASTVVHVRGIIDGKFDCGYLVTVKWGSKTLHGVVYHPHAYSTCASAQPNNAIVPYDLSPLPTAYNSSSSRKRRWRRRRGGGGDPGRPKPNRSGYNFFFAEKHSKLKSLYPNREREFTKMIGESWSQLSQEERMVYQNIGLKDKERYKREMKEYKERLNSLQPPKEHGRSDPSSHETEMKTNSTKEI